MAIRGMILPAVMAIMGAATPLKAQMADCETAVGQQNRAREQVGVSRGGGAAMPRGPAQGSTTQLALRLIAQISRGRVPASTALLFYASDGAGGYMVCLVDRNGLVASAPAGADEDSLINAIERVRWAYGVEELQRVRSARRTDEPTPEPPADVPPVSDAEDDLARMVLPPEVAAALRNRDHLIIVPAGPIGTIPFPALRPFGNGTALVDRTSITIAPSLREFADAGASWQADAGFARPLVVGDPSLPPSAGWTIPPLPGARAEAQGIAERLGATLLVGEEAERERVAAQAGQASLIYIAAHGSADPERPLDGGLLMLSGPTFQGGWWTARQIQSAQLAAELAVLSACQTGLGQVHEGGMIGLARAFQIAGARRVVMSLWNVNDQATRLMMTEFVRLLAQHAPAEALRRAMIETRRTYPEPAFWASFLAFGTAR